MAQETKSTAPEDPKAPDTTQIPLEDAHDSRFHYYSGGEVKELADTRVSPVLWVFWTFLIVAAIGYLFYGGALGPQFGGFKPTGGSDKTKAQIQAALNQVNFAGLNTLDLNRLPRPSGQSLDDAVAAGQTVYETNCIGCHGQNRDGNGVNAANLNPKPRNLTDAPFMQAMSYQRIMTSLHKGVPGTAMPRWENTISEPEIQDVAIYVFSLTTPLPAAAAAPGTATTAGVTSGAPATNGSSTGNAGGSHTYAGGSQSSPAPITPPINGNPAAGTSTAPPSASSTPATVNQPVSPDAGGQSAGPAFQAHPQKPAGAAPVPGSSTPNASTSSPGGGGGI